MNKIGVVVGRFHIENLHNGHLNLLNEVNKLSDKMVICLGVTQAKGERKNPLDYKTREIMLKGLFPNADIYPLHDRHSDEVWTEKLDELLSEYDECNEQITLFGGKDSFIPHYTGKFNTQILDHIIVDGLHATTHREQIAKEPIDSVDFRKGVIYSVFDRYPVNYMAVDIAVMDNLGRVLLGRKPDEKLYRFVGGFTDPTDESLEAAANREAVEELGNIKLEDFTYLGSYRINDWRYAGSINGIMTSFFVCKYTGGNVEASDDIEVAKWFHLNQLEEEHILSGHRQLLRRLKEYYNS